MAENIALLTLCATSRLAQHLRQQPPPGAAVWQIPATLTPAQWLDQLADDALLGGVAELPPAFMPLAEQLVWEAIIAPALGEAGAPFFDLAGLAASAAEAHAISLTWAIPATAAPGASDEARLFAGWQRTFVTRAQALGHTTPASRQLATLSLIEAGHFTLPAAVRFLGFDRLTPLEQRLTSSLRTRGVMVEALPAPETGHRPLAASPHATRRAYADREAECRAAASWAADTLDKTPAARLGIVAPDLDSRRALLEAALEETLAPALLRPDSSDHPRPFNLSLGTPLADEPLVATALSLLALGNGQPPQPQATLSRLLLAPGWGDDQQETDARARLDAELRASLPPRAPAAALLRLARRLAGGPGTTAAALDRLFRAAQGAPRTAPADAWASRFADELAEAGWPGRRPLNSREYQARERFLAALGELAHLAPFAGSLRRNEALRRLGQLCRQQIFQPQTRGTPPVQVLGILESAGLHFDALWVMGMNDDRWPAPPHPHPFLPVEAQRAAGAPHAGPAVELTFARQVHARLLAAAPTVVFSAAEADGTRVLRPSPLIVPLAPESSPPVRASLAAQMTDDDPTVRVSLDDALAPPLATGAAIDGGSALLRAQAICPAWAFYQYRLHARALATPSEGLDPAARGSLVHAVLDALWGTVHSLDAWQALPPAASEAAIARAVETGLAAFTAHRPALPPRLLALETRRLNALLAQWLTVEARRPAPFSVVAREQRIDITLEGLPVTLIVDRIDHVDGQPLVIDYKTGRQIDTRNWASERLTEPQLPLYAAFAAPGTAGVVFARVSADDPRFSGCAAREGWIPRLAVPGSAHPGPFPADRFPDWPSVVAHWRTRLAALATEIRQGVAGVVIEDDTLLAHCEVLPLLRLPERRYLLNLLPLAHAS